VIEQTVGEYRARLEDLIHQGRSLRTTSSEGSQGALHNTLRAWHHECGAIVNELSGGSKAHWLARAFSEAFLVRSTAGGAIAQVPVADIIDRIVVVLDRASQSLSQIEADSAGPATMSPAPAPHRFDFVRNASLRPVLEQAYAEGRAAFDEGRYTDSLMTTCGVLEAILTDALESIGRSPHGWTFHARIEAAEQAGLVRRGCARLPHIARNYRELTGADGQLPDHLTVTARDANTTTQVLHIVMRDLNPGR